jgi:hypothetical protein
MTNTLNKIMHNGDEYLFPEWFTPESVWTTWDVLTKTAGGYEWAAPSWWDVMVSSQANNILTSWMKIWAWEETDYANLWTYDNNTLYLTIPDQS